MTRGRARRTLFPAFKFFPSDPLNSHTFQTRHSQDQTPVSMLSQNWVPGCVGSNRSTASESRRPSHRDWHWQRAMGISKTHAATPAAMPAIQCDITDMKWVSCVGYVWLIVNSWNQGHGELGSSSPTPHICPTVFLATPHNA